MHGRIPHPMDTQRRDRQPRWGLPWRLAAVIALGLTLANSSAVQAKTFHCGAGNVACLIEAINEANANGEKNTIRLAAGTYTLTDIDNDTDGPNGLPSITSTLTMRGDGAATTILERASSAPVFRLVHVAASGHLTLKGVTLRGGGGDVRLGTIIGVFRGAGLYNNGGTVHLVQTTITQNQAFVHDTAGGGLFTTGGTVRITRSHFTNNAAFNGGGLLASGGVVIITQSTFAGNFADNPGGIGISSPAVVTLVDSTVEGSRGTFSGGISNRGLLLITNSTVAHNTASFGGGLENFGTTVILNATIAENHANVGGGLRVLSGTVTLQNTILASNEEFSLQSGDCRGVVTSLGTNLISDPTGCTITLQPSDLTGDPGLGPFTDNGRPGNGHFPLLPTSQTIDAGSDAVCPRTDQLGGAGLAPVTLGRLSSALRTTTSTIRRTTSTMRRTTSTTGTRRLRLANSAPAQPRSQGTEPPEGCSRHGVQMTLNHQEGRSWWSHQTAPGAAPPPAEWPSMPGP